MRASWDEYFMGIAHQAATRSTCPRKARRRGDRNETAPCCPPAQRLRSRLPHCEDAECTWKTAMHHHRAREANAILQAAKNAWAWTAESCTPPRRRAGTASS